MFLSTLPSSFIFNLPSDFIPPAALNDYDGIIDLYQMPYENILDFLNSTIKSITFPGLSLETNQQTINRGKKIFYKPATPVQDLVTTHEVNVVFRSVQGNLNYMILLDIFQKHYLDTEHLYVQPLSMVTLDPFRNGVFVIRYYQLVLKSLTETLFDYSIQKVNAQEFTLTFTFNFYELDSLFRKTKIIDVNNKSVLGNSLPIILNRH
jgi:hypothetical protein